MPSVAIDNGYALACFFDPLDQRGYICTDNACDVGALEAGGIPDVLFADGFGETSNACWIRLECASH